VTLLLTADLRKRAGSFAFCGLLLTILQSFLEQDLKDFRVSGVVIYRTRHAIHDWRQHQD
jgi:hypothetical protein